MTNITYRKSVEKDIPFVNELFIEMAKTVNERMVKEGIEPYTELENGFEEGYLESFYIDNNKIIYVALDNEKIIGFLSICKYDNYIYLDDYCVNYKYRGKGIGTKLMNLSYEYAKENNINIIKTHVESANHESKEYYQNKGFKLIKKEKNRLLIAKELN